MMFTDPLTTSMQAFYMGMATLGLFMGFSMIPETAKTNARLTPTEQKKRTQEIIDEYNENNVR